ncbi:uncharacterized protein LOC123872563 [Maniola jurtina]|uniref:uncharacterized protein LOC123872563 n=1 Tax=Maniola jurtina TaxID=191418 RepID=UPI001E687970|nr:uncharacterized protein LOC123872563 [Maniola jurtina]
MQVKLFIVIFVLVAGVDSSGIEDKVKQYFRSDVFKAFQKHWRAHRKSFENAILLTLKESYGNRGINIYVRQSADALKICTGLYGSDNVIDWLLLDITLTSLPNLIMPEMMFALASNFLHLEAGLSKMILEAKYTLIRNQSDIVYSAEEQTLHKSPFSYVQVTPYGQLAIIAEDCTIDGYVVTKLSGMSINLGHDTFQVRNCKFSVEISSNRQEPPIIAPYFTLEQSKQLELLLTRPIRAEMLPKLQAAVFTYINTSLVFGDYLPKIRDYQNNIFKETSKYVRDIAIAIDNKTIEENQATVDAPSISLTWDAKCPDEFCSGDVIVDNVTVHGLDTLYSAHTGGPIKMLSARIMESLRFNSLMVRGSTVYFHNDTAVEKHNFVAEIHDVAVDFEINVEKPEARFEVVSWRSFEFSIIRLEQRRDQKSLTAFIHGYLLNMLPILLNNHLRNTYKLLSNSKPLVGAVSTICDCGNQNKNKGDS